MIVPRVSAHLNAAVTMSRVCGSDIMTTSTATTSTTTTAAGAGASSAAAPSTGAATTRTATSAGDGGNGDGDGDNLPLIIGMSAGLAVVLAVIAVALVVYARVLRRTTAAASDATAVIVRTCLWRRLAASRQSSTIS